MAAERRQTDLKFSVFLTRVHPGKIEDYYVIGKCFGEGAYGQVARGTNQVTNQVHAIKAIDICKISDTKSIDAEISIQQQLDHPGIVTLYEVFKDAKRIYLVMELCTGGELFDRIVEEAEKHGGLQVFDERRAANYMQQILSAMRYLHEHNYVHRNIKLENFLLQSKHDDAAIKLINFAQAKRFVAGQDPLMKCPVGSSYYVAPQVLQGAYDEKCDIWSCGVIAYILLCGYPPFSGDRDEDIFRRVKAANFDFPSPDWDKISKDGKEIIKQMLTKDPAKRPCAAQLLQHDWLTQHADKPSGNVSNDLCSKLTDFTGVSKLKKMALTVIAQQTSEEDIEELKNTFLLLDENRDGTLTLAEVQMGLKRHNVAIPDGFEEILRSIDTDGSGTIDYTEFIAATMSNKQYLKKEVIWAAFRTFDKDGDGKITRADLKEMVKDDSLTEWQIDAEVDRIVKEIDLDGDGDITWEEFTKMMEEPGTSVPM